MVTHPAGSLAQDRESSPAETSVLTMLRRQQIMIIIIVLCNDVFYCVMQTAGVELCTKIVQIPEAHTFVVKYILR